MKYAIQDTTLTAIGDAIRDKIGYIGVDTFEEAQLLTEFEINTIEIQNPMYVSSNYWYIYDLKDFFPDYNLLSNFLSQGHMEIEYENLDSENYFRYASIASTEFDTNSLQFIKDYGNTIVNPFIFDCQKYVDNLYIILRSYQPVNVKVKIKLWGIDKFGKYLGKTNELYTPLEMVNKIEESITIPEQVFQITGNCKEYFADKKLDWFLELGKDKIETKDLTDIKKMFYNSNVSEIPFEINCSTARGANQMFYGCKKLKVAPKINNLKFGSNADSESIRQMFYDSGIEEIPEGYGSNWSWTGLHQTVNQLAISGVFTNSKVKRIAPDFLKEIWNSYMPKFSGEYLLELVKYPVPQNGKTATSILQWAGDSWILNLPRLHRLVFDTDENNMPYVVNWANITVGLKYSNSSSGTNIGVFNKNSDSNAVRRGPHKIVDDKTYQQYKDLDDAWTEDINYSFYNHDSAVETINSLPDTSAFLTSNGGTNTIQFSGASGALTDGGAINTLTEEEIAVAIAKGWTVSF